MAKAMKVTSHGLLDQFERPEPQTSTEESPRLIQQKKRSRSSSRTFSAVATTFVCLVCKYLVFLNS